MNDSGRDKRQSFAIPALGHLTRKLAVFEHLLQHPGRLPTERMPD